MAKMFYSLEEAASKLKKSVGDVRQMAARGEITEFRDGDRLIFKVDQIDLLAGEDEHEADMSSMIPLADTGGGSALGLADSTMPTSRQSKSGSGSGSAIEVESPKERSGVPVFDADELEEADPSAVTQVSDGDAGAGLSLESLGSGSGLMDLTRESDDTSLGAEGLLDELYPSEEAGAGDTKNEEGGLFEGAPAGGELGGGPEAGVLVAAAAEIYDGAGSGLVGGAAFAAIAALAVGLVVVLMSMSGMTPAFFGSLGGEMAPLVWMGIFAGLLAVAAGVGFVLGKKSG